MNRDEALILLRQNVTDEHHINHSLAVEAIMRELAKRLQEDEEKYGMAGLLHDIDYDVTFEKPEQHGLLGAQILEQHGFPEDIIYAVKAHNERHGLERKTLLDKALYAADPTSGFVTAAAMVRPEKKLENVELKSLKKRFKEKAFARGCNREQMATCAELGLELDEFLDIALISMKKCAAEIGL